MVPVGCEPACCPDPPPDPVPPPEEPVGPVGLDGDPFDDPGRPGRIAPMRHVFTTWAVHDEPSRQRRLATQAPVLPLVEPEPEPDPDPDPAGGAGAVGTTQV